METIEKALAFEKEKRRSLSTSDRVKISRQAKTLILELNQLYKANNDAGIMELMKRLTVIKRKVEKRLKGVHLVF